MYNICYMIMCCVFVEKPLFTGSSKDDDDGKVGKEMSSSPGYEMLSGRERRVCVTCIY